MLRRGALYGILLVCVLETHAGAQLPALGSGQVSQRTLANGLSVVVKEERQWPVVSVGVFIRAGSLHEAPGQEGAAHLVEHLLFEATGDGGVKLAPEIEAIGGRVAATTMRDFVQLNVTVASRYLEDVLPLIVRAVFEAKLDEQVLQREIEVIKREMADRQERADLYLLDMLWRLAFREHPYGRPIGGRPEDVGRLSLQVLESFRSTHYVPGNMSIVAVGDVDGQWLMARLNELTRQYEGGTREWTAPPVETAPATPRVLTAQVERDVSLLGVAWHAPSIAEKGDVCAMDLIYTLLGASASGRLRRALVDEKRVALSVDTQFLTQKEPGLFIVTALVPKGREQEAQAFLLDEVRKLTESSPSDAELDQAKRLLYADYAFTNESYDEQVGSMGFYESIDTYRFALDYVSAVMAITPDQVRETARKYLRPDAYSLVVLQAAGGPGEADQGVEL